MSCWCLDPAAEKRGAGRAAEEAARCPDGRGEGEGDAAEGARGPGRQPCIVLLSNPNLCSSHQVYSLNKLNELLKKMLLNEKSGESEQAQYEIDAAFWKSEFECPICFEVRVTTVILNMVTTVAML